MNKETPSVQDAVVFVDSDPFLVKTSLPIASFRFPLKNVPLLFYTLDALVLAGITRVYLVTAAHFAAVNSLLKIYTDVVGTQVLLKLVKAPPRHTLVELLRHFEFFDAQLEEPFLLVEKLFVGTLPLCSLQRTFQLADTKMLRAVALFSKKQDGLSSRVFVVLQDTTTSKLLICFGSSSDFPEVKLPADFLTAVAKNEPASVVLRYGLEPAGVWLLEKSFFSVFRENFDYSTMQQVFSHTAELELSQTFLSVVTTETSFHSVRSLVDYEALFQAGSSVSFTCPFFSQLAKSFVVTNARLNVYELRPVSSVTPSFDGAVFCVPTSLSDSKLAQCYVLDNCKLDPGCSVGKHSVLFSFTRLPPNTVVVANSLVFTVPVPQTLPTTDKRVLGFVETMFLSKILAASFFQHFAFARERTIKSPTKQHPEPGSDLKQSILALLVGMANLYRDSETDNSFTFSLVEFDVQDSSFLQAYMDYFALASYKILKLQPLEEVVLRTFVCSLKGAVGTQQTKPVSRVVSVSSVQKDGRICLSLFLLKDAVLELEESRRGPELQFRFVRSVVEVFDKTGSDICDTNRELSTLRISYGLTDAVFKLCLLPALLVFAVKRVLVECAFVVSEKDLADSSALALCLDERQERLAEEVQRCLADRFYVLDQHCASNSLLDLCAFCVSSFTLLDCAVLFAVESFLNMEVLFAADLKAYLDNQKPLTVLEEFTAGLRDILQMLEE